MSARENIANNIVEQLENMTNPAPGHVSRVFFDVQKLAITQFPVAKAGAIFQLNRYKGRFHGEIHPTMPSGFLEL